MLAFFRGRLRAENTRPDPKQEGRFSLQRNRRSSWHLADFKSSRHRDSDSEDLENHDVANGVLPENCKRESGEEVEEEEEEEGDASHVVRSSVVFEILAAAKSLPENATLGDMLGAYQGEISKGDCIELLRKMGKEGMASQCMYLFEWMRVQDPTLVTPRACSLIFPVLGQARMGQEILLLLQNLPPGRNFRDVRVFNAAISGLASAGRYDDAWRTFESMETKSIRPDYATCSIMITVLRKTGRCAKDAWDFFQMLEKRGTGWSLEAVGNLMKSLCDEGLRDEAISIQSEMEKRGIVSNVIIYNTLMDAYSKSNQVEVAEGLFTEMKEKGLQPTAATFNILMDAYGRRMQPEIIESLLAEMEVFGLKPDVKSYTCLISAYGRQREMSEEAARSFLRMKKAGIKPTSYSYTALIHAYSVDGWYEKAYLAYEHMKREGIRPSVETYTALLDACRRGGDMEKLLKIWKLMREEKIECTRITFNTILDGLAKHGMYVEARDVVHEFGKMGLQPSLMTYNMLMNAYARGGQHDKLPELLEEMAAWELKPDPVTYATIIYAYVRVRDFSRAFYYHQQMVRNGQAPDAASYQKMRRILSMKAATKNRRDRHAIMGIVNSEFGIRAERRKKDKSWKKKKKNISMKAKAKRNERKVVASECRLGNGK